MELEALWIVAGCFLTWLLLPDLWIFLRGVPVNNRVDDEPAAFERYWDECVAYEPQFRELEALGFQRLCVYHENLGGVHEHEFFFVLPRENIFASVYRLSLSDGPTSTPRIAMLTTFTSGAAIVTRSAGDVEPTRGDDFWEGAAMPASEVEPVRDEPAGNWHAIFMIVHLLAILLTGGGVLTFLAHYHLLAVLLMGGAFAAFSQGRRLEPTQPAESPRDLERWRAPIDVVLGEHRRRVSVFTQSGHIPVGDNSPAGLLEAQRTYYRVPYVRKVAFVLHTIFFGLKLTFFGVGIGLAAVLLGVDHWSVPAAAIGLSLVWVGLRAYMRASSRPTSLAVESQP